MHDIESQLLIVVIRVVHTHRLVLFDRKLREGGIIIAFEDHPTDGIDDLHKLLSEDRIGHKSSLVVIRGTEKLMLEVIPKESQSGVGK